MAPPRHTDPNYLEKAAPRGHHDATFQVNDPPRHTDPNYLEKGALSGLHEATFQEIALTRCADLTTLKQGSVTYNTATFQDVVDPP